MQANISGVTSGLETIFRQLWILNDVSIQKLRGQMFSYRQMVHTDIPIAITTPHRSTTLLHVHSLC
jgi:hypothetical protein